MLSFLKYLLQLVMSPHRGWEEVSADSRSAEQLTQTGLYPLIGIAALSEFIQYFYVRELGLITLLERALAEFVTYFATYFIARTVLEMAMPSLVSGEPNARKIDRLVIYSLSLMVIIEIIANALPVNIPIVTFLPIVVLVVIWKSSLYLSVRQDREIMYVAVAGCSVILLPILLYALFSLIIM